MLKALNQYSKILILEHHFVFSLDRLPVRSVPSVPQLCSGMGVLIPMSSPKGIYLCYFIGT